MLIPIRGQSARKENGTVAEELDVRRSQIEGGRESQQL